MKIGIIGSGQVGSATAFNLIVSGIAHEVVLIDKNEARASAEALDISHAAPHFHANKIYSGSYSELNGADIVIITAGVNQKPGQTRLDLLKINAQIFKEIIPQVTKFAQNAILVIASNPVDIMTKISLKLSGIESNRVFGSGTLLDSTRFKTELSNHFGISSKSIDAYVLGEHGDSETLLWSSAKIGLINIEEFAKKIGKPLTEDIKNSIERNVKQSAYTIISGKGATFFGIAGALCNICHAIAMNSNAILPLSVHNNQIADAKNVCMAVPAILNRSGAVKTLMPNMTEQEYSQLKKSANIIEKYTNDILSLI